MLLEGYDELLSARSMDELSSALRRSVEALEFEKFAAVVITDLPTGEAQFEAVHNTPDGYLQYFNDVERGRRDPIMRHCKFSGLPLLWNQETYVKAERGEEWEEQAFFGYKCGIAVALHLPCGQHFFIGIDRERDLPRERHHLTRLVGGLQLLAVHTNEVARHIVLAQPYREGSPRLTARELESLRWTKEGKTAWEVGKIMLISEQTAARHVNNAMHKLGCISKHQAAIRAYSLGLIK